MTPGDLPSHLDPEDVALAALGEAVSEAAEHHLATCMYCRDQVEDLAEVVLLGRSGIDPSDDETPPERVWTSVRDGASPSGGTQAVTVVPVARPGTDASTPAHGRGLRGRRLTFLPLLAAAVVGLMVGAGLVAAVDAWQAAPTVLASAVLAPVPDGPPGAHSGTAEVTVVDGIEMLAVTTHDLSKPGGFYEVWLIDFDSGSMIAMGSVPPGAQGILLPIPPGVDLAQYRAVDISDEPFDGDPAHSTVSVLRGDLAI